MLLSLFVEIGEGDFLEDHVGGGGFVEDAEVVFVDHDEGGVGTAFGV